MQPELQSLEEIEKEPEKLPIVQTPVEAITVQAETPTAQKKSSKLNIAAIILGFFVFVLILVAGGLGYWGYTLNTRLVATQQQLATLQGDYAKLQADYAKLTTDKEKLNTDLTQFSADLDKVNADLAAAQSDLKDSQGKNNDLNLRLSKAKKLAEVLYAWNTSKQAADVFTVDALVKKSNDAGLLKKWNSLFTSSPSQENLDAFVDFLIADIRDSLK